MKALKQMSKSLPINLNRISWKQSSFLQPASHAFFTSLPINLNRISWKLLWVITKFRIWTSLPINLNRISWKPSDGVHNYYALARGLPINLNRISWKLFGWNFGWNEDRKFHCSCNGLPINLNRISWKPEINSKPTIVLLGLTSLPINLNRISWKP